MQYKLTIIKGALVEEWELTLVTGAAGATPASHVAIPVNGCK